MTTARVLVVGFSAGLINALESIGPDAPEVYVLEEPTIHTQHREEYDRDHIVSTTTGRYIHSDEAVEVGVAWHETVEFDAVIPGKEFAVPAAAHLAEVIGVRYPGPVAVNACTDKLEFRQLLDKHGFPAPRYASVRNTGEVFDFFDEQPIVLKPRDRHASLGVRLVGAPGEIETAWAESTGTDQGTHKPTDRKLEFTYMVEEFIPGDEFSVEILVSDAAVMWHNITDKTVGPLPWFAEMGHSVPSATKPETAELLIDNAHRLAQALEVRDGLLHSEWKVHGGEVFPIECAARFPGDRIPMLIEAVYGFNLADGWLKVLARTPEAIRPHAMPMGCASTQFLRAEPGVVTSVVGVADFLHAYDVLEMSVPQIGDTVGASRDSHSRPGFGVFRCPNRASLDAGIRQWRDIAVETQ